MRLHLVFAIIICSILSSCNDHQDPLPEKPRPIVWSKVSLSDSSQLRRISGTLQAVETAQLSFNVSGRVSDVMVNLGDTVSKNQPLAKLDDKDFDLLLQGMRAELEQTEARVVETKAEFERYSELVQKQLVSKSGYDNVKSAYRAAVGARDLAISRLEITENEVADTVLYAPYNGKITQRFIEPSQQINANQAAFSIEGDNGLEISAIIPEGMIQRLTQGSVYDVHFPAIRNLVLKAKLTEIGSRAITASAFPVTLNLLEQNEKLRAGMSAEIDFVFIGEGLTGYNGATIKIPISAIYAGANNQNYVFVFNADTQRLEKRKIQEENIVDNEVLISSGLSENEIIATAGVSFMHDGMHVRLLDENHPRFK